MSEAAKQGKEFCENQPGLIVAAVWQEAMIHFKDRADQMAFVNGYIDERRRMDENRPSGESKNEGSSN